MADALIGSTGFVGGNLLRQRPFDDLFNSRNIATLGDRAFDTIVCAGAPAEKWRANRDPDEDRARLATLTGALDRARARRVILVSTVDVYPVPVGVDEESPIDTATAQPYGRHRYELERFVQERFDTLVVRLPGLFGTGIKKNIIFDFLNDNNVSQVHADSVFQFYGLDTLWPDIEIALANGLTVVNFATEPVSVGEVAREAFGMEFDNRPASSPARYDFRSRHAALYGGRDGYLQDRARVLAALGAFVRRERAR